MSALTTNTAVTMTSLELVEIINSLREEGRTELRHDNFLVKIEKHPGIDSPKFLGQYKDSTGRALKCYHLPKREAELMVMSESLAVQTKVYDRMSALEQRVGDHVCIHSLQKRQKAPTYMDEGSKFAGMANLHRIANSVRSDQFGGVGNIYL